MFQISCDDRQELRSRFTLSDGKGKSLREASGVELKYENETSPNSADIRDSPNSEPSIHDHVSVPNTDTGTDLEPDVSIRQQKRIDGENVALEDSNYSDHKDLGGA